MCKKIQVVMCWLLACIMAFCLVNGIAFLYRYDPKWLKRTGGMTNGLYIPESKVIYNDEGKGYSIIDDNGYVNCNAALGEDYILVFGNSQSNGHNVHYSETYVYILNKMLGITDETYVYNVSNGGYTICDIVKGFKAGITEFPNSSAIIIQIGNTDFNTDIMENSLKQKEYSIEDSIDYLLNHQTMEERIRGIIKNYFPFVTIIAAEKYPKLDKGINNVFTASFKQDNNEDTYKSEEYKEVLSKALRQLKEEYKGKLVILYLPTISIENEGMIINYSTSFNDFVSVCLEYDIQVVDMGIRYLECYQADYSVPYGFNNTSPGEGHLNKKGHEMVAQCLIEIVDKVYNR